MYCPNCGAELDNDAKFCTSCGNKIEDEPKLSHSHENHTVINEKPLEDDQTDKIIIPSSDNNTKQTSQSPKPSQSVSMSKTTLRNIALGILALLLIGAGYRYWKNRPVEIALADYYDVTFEGADGFGRLNYEFDEAKFVNDNRDKIQYLYPSRETARINPIEITSELANELDYYTEVFAEPAEELSNGDEVKLSFNTDVLDIENVYKVKVKNTDKTVKVDGLMEVSEVSPADYFEVEVEGISPNASLSVVRKDDAPEYFEFVYPRADKTNNLSSGDEVEITFDYDEEAFIEEYGVIISPKTIKVPIDGLASYISSYDELSNEDKKEIEEEAGYQIDDQVRGWSEADLTNKELVGTITISPKENSGYNWGSNNYLYLVYKLTATENIPEKNYKYNFSYYNFVEFTNVLNSEDDDLYENVDISNKTLKHRVTPDATGFESIYYEGYYFMDLLMKKLYDNFSEDSYNYDISFNLDDYRVKSSGIAGDYQSDQGPILRLAEDGNAYYIQYGDEALEGSYSGDGEDFRLSLRGINDGKALSGIVTESKKIRVPDQGGWSGEVFTKLY